MSHMSESNSITYDDTFLSPLDNPNIHTIIHERREDIEHVINENRPNTIFETHVEPPRTISSSGIIDHTNFRHRADPTWQVIPDAVNHLPLPAHF
ncbi:retrotransposon Tca4 polyprotein, putative [Candida dubliniensis CD36]|uniref:Retrotransposon Tca4 polyprotein, putative n=1 Tax=Candida dubliniensis (strain CD36 / ATCC MYA-646 / CBS 7987 / NCPF 3949 / NRRL Y-17841) TaxID=573826 RepID=B9WGU6_CANDC|nr:retrotransposon Tca4 polyprotein, putative [Candida dubliniensis CD36]CAX41384.1 retrotransposon Tca4 polyprotein, putative [Candida dubliniensis CD36]